jgi:hypothetical protein
MKLKPRAELSGVTIGRKRPSILATPAGTWSTGKSVITLNENESL